MAMTYTPSLKKQHNTTIIQHIYLTMNSKIVNNKHKDVKMSTVMIYINVKRILRLYLYHPSESSITIKQQIRKSIF